MAAQASGRITWAVERLDPQPGERVLEVGFGHGVALSLIAERLDGRGALVGLERSATMVAAAQRRNADHVASGLLRLVTGEIATADLGDARFDKVLAIHVPVLQRGADPSAELTALRAHLAPGGGLWICFQPHRPEEAAAIADRLAATLAACGWRAEPPVLEDVPSGRCGCVVARP